MRLIYILFSLSLVSCEIITIKAEYKRTTKKVDLLQDTPEGTIYLFRTELNNGNSYAAADFFNKPNRQYLAIERLELIDEADRYKRIFGDKLMTTSKIDTLANEIVSIQTKLNYNKKVKFETNKRDSSWYISEIVIN